MNYWTVIPAAGQGKRMNAGISKQWIELLGKPVLAHTLDVFEKDPACAGIILVGSEQELQQMQNFVQTFQYTKVRQIVPGGEERQQSVYEGLKKVPEDADLVLVHDAARPFITIDSIGQLVNKAVDTGSAVLAVPVKDTVKRVVQHQVEETIDRSSLWAVQTPQAFRLSIVKRAHEEADSDGYLGTDDASLVERIGETVAIVMGDYHNIKLTTSDDLLYGQAILLERQGEKA
ncbi:2-C-methyl-D-erythritol 4-phosphate cytidylyltransferase [Fictibacillus barbaricus]|uniref:2-C-methyl-D-erythritol 4-phosphate cytidylyltransferase n=1 Tax=Fictibacillus barbaricus TaxID=182136 RepID=A0ABS2Z7U0_9BACL|nr:2-C-methyl-D-erythritol 4-phosphate cytidylyltransferase [Fictibacillus barbaricus]MBN3544088.1 2-C-methyl-D-erythritol 4-phosphate cytidylyltransferase [Fictibacillus barbaricus]GGB70978.1 2-C-methyl-D-erythritol 4-phosphate cytidylyltransferase [Fictibacillus barbaricus]